MKHTSLLAMMQPEPAKPEPLPYDDSPATPDESSLLTIMSMVDMSHDDSVARIAELTGFTVGEVRTIEASELDLSQLEYDYNPADRTLTIETPDGYTIHCPEVITSAIQGYEFGDAGSDPENLWNTAKVSAKSTSLSRPGNKWSWSYAAFLKLVCALAEVDLEERPDGEARIKVCRICGRTACPYHGQPDGWVYIKVTL